MPTRKIYLTDDEVARIIRRSPSSMGKIVNGFVRGGVKRKTHSVLSQNLMAAEPEDFGGYRLWRVSKFAKAFGFTEEEVLAAAEL